MPCENYKDALIEAAATGLDLANAPDTNPKLHALGAHLAECVSCRTAFAEEQSLFAAIDSNLHATANEEVPASLLPRVRARLDETAAPRLRWLQPLVFASAGVALAFAVFLVARPHHVEREEVAKGPVIVPTLTAPATKTNPEKTSPEDAQIAAIRVSHARTSRNSTNLRSAASSNPEVLVPLDEREAFALFLSRSQRPGVQTAVRTELVLRPPEESVEILPVEVALLKVKPLDGDNGQQAQSRAP